MFARSCRRKSRESAGSLHFRPALIALLICCGATAARGDLVLNGSFELPDHNATLTDGLPYYFYVRTTPLTDWTIVGSTLAFFDSRPPKWLAADGNQYVELESGFGQAIFQTLTTVPGDEYTIRFAYAPNPLLSAASPDDSLTVLWNGALVATVEHLDATVDDLDWLYYEFTVTATGNSSVLRFQDGSIGAPFIGPFLDHVSVNPTRIPEATTSIVVGLLIIGLAVGHRCRGRTPCTGPCKSRE